MDEGSREVVPVQEQANDDEAIQGDSAEEHSATRTANTGLTGIKAGRAWYKDPKKKRRVLETVGKRIYLFIYLFTNLC